ncbi:DMT family transporter [Phaeovulum vinaykumarii]|uniref:EamA-like transporter family protein n=1 Tax=Phaeovulum vinaykumarii TaxID=407234 RepID=A0A1N7MKL7_9RHOB|nr:DMT family transporter [Phaeovulum vinaykumarii]SIS86562.1 EamA-like transporter family protein [Phaeovulum vinaykumarii]SOC13517.1 EamA-like transporter family protein [Phaeovulum vinaykumarii]
MTSGEIRGHLAMLVFAAFVAGSFPLGAMVANVVDPAALNTLRFALAAGLLLGVALATRGRAAYRGAFAAPWRHLILGGLFAAYFVMMFEGLKTATPVDASAIFTLTPLMSAVFGLVLLGQRVTLRIAAALLLGAAGALWVIFRGDFAALVRFEIGRGEAIYFLGCVAHAIYTPLVRLLNRGEPAVVFSQVVLSASFALLAVYAAPAILATDWLHQPMIVWIALAYTAVFATSATAVLLQFAALSLPSSKVMAYTYLVPSTVILWQVALGAGMPPAITLPGIAATVAALAILLRA